MPKMARKSTRAPSNEMPSITNNTMAVCQAGATP
jgi:hypothetical protein